MISQSRRSCKVTTRLCANIPALEAAGEAIAVPDGATMVLSGTASRVAYASVSRPSLPRNGRSPLPTLSHPGLSEAVASPRRLS